MPIAALPEYLLRQDLSHASPGMRFGLYLPIWTTRNDQESEVHKRAEARSREGDEVKALLHEGMDAAIDRLRQRQPRPLPGLWDKNDFAARSAWSNVKKLTKEDHTRMTALADRQSAMAQTAPADGLLLLDALATAPFTTGLGNEHPLENGFAFLNPYGLPYLPGSGVKGVLRQAARELASGDWGDAHDWSEDRSYPLVVAGKPVLDTRKQAAMLSQIDVLFGRDSPPGESDHVRGALCFWDVIPQIKGDSLMVEIMTPHQTHYYQIDKKKNPQTPHFQSPHESGQPNPISFLIVPPGSQFVFCVQCDLALLGRRAPDLAKDARWTELLRAAFTHAFDWLGFGAKTAVGYGAMERDRSAEEAARKQAEQEAERRAQAEEVRRRQEAEAAAVARRRAEFEALPESAKALEQLRQALAMFDGAGQLDKNRFADLTGLLKHFAKQAQGWTDAGDRARAAGAITAACERFGWAPPGLKRDKREKKERERRTEIDELRARP